MQGEVQELAESFFTAEYIVDFHPCWFSLSMLIGPFKILYRFIRIALVEILNLVQLLVELLELVAGRDSLNLFFARFVRISVDLEQPLRLFLDAR